MSTTRIPTIGTRRSKKLTNTIGNYIDYHNDHPSLFNWTARATDILEKVKRAHRTLLKSRSESRTPLQ